MGSLEGLEQDGLAIISLEELAELRQAHKELQWHIEHDPGCTHVLVTQLLAHIEKALPLLQAAEALEEAFVKGSSLIVTIQLDYTDATQYGRMVSIEIQNLDKLPRRVLAGTVACLTVADAIADTPRILGEIL